MRKSKRQKNELSKRRFDAIKNMMSTFAMSTVAVVAAVVLIPASPKAEITKTVALNDEIVYQVFVTDEENALDSSSLFIVLENQLEYYEQSIGLGENSSFFSGLEYDTVYKLSVYGDKGFGMERLATTNVKTREKIGATIKSVSELPNEWSRDYQVEFSINDPQSKYLSYNLYYGFSWEHDTEIMYSSIPIDRFDTVLELYEIATHEPFHIYIEGVTLEGTEVLDEVWVTPPFRLHASVYMDFLSKDRIGFYAYGDEDAEDISFKMEVYQNEMLIKTEKLTSSGDYHSESQIIVDGLTPDTMYYFVCKVVYDNPLTLATEETIIYSEELMTLGDYSYDIKTTKVDEGYNVEITMNDPNDYFQQAYYDIYEPGEEYNMYLYGEVFNLIVDGNTKSLSFTLFTPENEHYEIIIGLRNNYNYTIYEKIKTISK